MENKFDYFVWYPVTKETIPDNEGDTEYILIKNKHNKVMLQKNYLVLKQLVSFKENGTDISYTAWMKIKI
jgi:hypothetical protein